MHYESYQQHTLTCVCCLLCWTNICWLVFLWLKNALSRFLSKFWLKLGDKWKKYWASGFCRYWEKLQRQYAPTRHKTASQQHLSRHTTCARECGFSPGMSTVICRCYCLSLEVPVLKIPVFKCESFFFPLAPLLVVKVNVCPLRHKKGKKIL